MMSGVNVKAKRALDFEVRLTPTRTNSEKGEKNTEKTKKTQTNKMYVFSCTTAVFILILNILMFDLTNKLNLIQL